MKKLFLILLAFITLYAEPATKEDIKELKQDIKLLINKVNEIDKKVYANSIKIDMLEKHMNARFKEIDKRFEDMNKRFEEMNTNFNRRFEEMNNNFNRRFEEMNNNFNNRFEEMNKRFEDMMNYLWMISAAFLGLTAVTIGFAIWDRKSMIKAAKEEIVEDIKQNRLKEFIFELKKLSQKDPELAKVLKSFHIL